MENDWTNLIAEWCSHIFRFQLSTLHLSHSPLKKSQIKIKLPIDKSNKILYTIKADKKVHTSGCSAAGSAPHLGCGCRRFDSCHSDQNSSFNFGWDCYFLCIWYVESIFRLLSIQPPKYNLGNTAEIPWKRGFGLYMPESTLKTSAFCVFKVTAVIVIVYGV